MPNHLANLDVMGADHLLFGTDSPPLATPLEDAIAMVEQLPLSAEEKQGVLEGNARRLFGLDGARRRLKSPEIGSDLRTADGLG